MKTYGFQPKNPEKMSRACVRDVRVSFKKTRETAAAISGMTLEKAVSYLSAVREFQRAVPFRRFNRGVGRCAQAKEWGTTQARWPVKSAMHLLAVLRNAASNAETNGLRRDVLYVKNVQVQQASKLRRRTYRAHGRINAFQSHPCHIELFLAESPREIARVSKAAKRKELLGDDDEDDAVEIAPLD